MIPTAIIVTVTALAQNAADWKGRIEKKGDIVVVKNPNKPVFAPGALSLEEELAIGGEEGAGVHPLDR